jgi:hypothetical protein
MGRAAHLDRLVLADAVAGLLEAPFAGENLARHHQGLGLGPALGQSTRDQGLIQARAGRVHWVRATT